jgi:hypothetical protein
MVRTDGKALHSDMAACFEIIDRCVTNIPVLLAGAKAKVVSTLSPA